MEGTVPVRDLWYKFIMEKLKAVKIKIVNFTAGFSHYGYVYYKTILQPISNIHAR